MRAPHTLPDLASRLILIAGISLPALASAQAPDSTTSASAAAAAPAAPGVLATSTAPPWNPPGPVSSSQPWEAVVRFPARVVSLPLSALGQGTRVALLAAERNFIAQRIAYQLRKVPLPVTLGPAGLGDRTGTGVRAGLDVRQGPAVLHGSFEVSTRGYTRLRTRLAAGPVELDYHEDRRPADRFFGLGMNSSLDEQARYGLQEDRATLRVTFADRERGPGGPRRIVSAWTGPRWSELTQGYGEDEPSILERFPVLFAPSVDRHFEHLTYGASVALDTRGGIPHWTRGWMSRFSGERFDRPLVASPSRTGAQFTRYEWRSEAGFSLGRDPRTLRLRVTAVDVEVSGDPARMMPHDLARLGGAAGLPGFEAQRFHELDGASARLAYIFPLAQYVEMNVHGDAGAVFTDLQNDFRFNRLRHSAGFAVRARTKHMVVGSIGLDFSPETTRVVFAVLSDG